MNGLVIGLIGIGGSLRCSPQAEDIVLEMSYFIPMKTCDGQKIMHPFSQDNFILYFIIFIPHAMTYQR